MSYDYKKDCKEFERTHKGNPEDWKPKIKLPNWMRKDKDE